MTVVRAAHNWATNSLLIAEVARLGYLDGSVFDASVGEAAGFWKAWQPLVLVTNDVDLTVAADRHWDARHVPLPDGSFDSVVWDAPYKLKGTPALVEQDGRYGTTKRTTRAEVLELVVDGAVESHRLCRRFVLVKCMDQVEGGRMRWQTDLVSRALEDCGAYKVDRFDFLGGGRSQPGGRQQRTAYFRPSTLLVFSKTKRDPRP